MKGHAVAFGWPSSHEAAKTDKFHLLKGVVFLILSIVATPTLKCLAIGVVALILWWEYNLQSIYDQRPLYAFYTRFTPKSENFDVK